MRFQIAAGLSDFLVTLGCLALVFICVLLLSELIGWLRGDAGESLGLFEGIFKKVLRSNPVEGAHG